MVAKNFFSVHSLFSYHALRKKKEKQHREIKLIFIPNISSLISQNFALKSTFEAVSEKPIE